MRPTIKDSLFIALLAVITKICIDYGGLDFELIVLMILYTIDWRVTNK